MRRQRGSKLEDIDALNPMKVFDFDQVRQRGIIGITGVLAGL